MIENPNFQHSRPVYSGPTVAQQTIPPIPKLPNPINAVEKKGIL